MLRGVPGDFGVEVVVAFLLSLCEGAGDDHEAQKDCLELIPPCYHF